jgi:predicted DNA-binding transcriptional regulator AlpA
MVKSTQEPSSFQGLIDREKLAARLCCSIETIKRMEKRGLLKRVQLGERLVRYRLSDIQKLEGYQQA